jgi:hypothetical protein
MPKPVKNTIKKKKTEGMKKGWTLTPTQGALLQDLFRTKFEDGEYDAEYEFAWHVVIEELITPANTGTPPRPRSDYDGEIKSALQHMSRTVRGIRTFSRPKLRVYAKVLGMQYSVLRSRLGLSEREQDSEAIPQTEIAEPPGPDPHYSPTPAIYVPWVTEDSILTKYRARFHHYHQTKQGDDLFWIYTPIDFSIPCKGYLCDPS